MAPFTQVLATKEHPLAFAKMAGGGNDFVMIDHRQAGITNPGELTRRICTRALSVGADGLILVEPSPRASVRIRYYNSDGSLGEFCGNGTRCAARFAYLSELAPRKMTLETDAGIVSAEVLDDERVTISLPPPNSFRADRPLDVEGTTVRGSSIVVGVPHYVVFLRDDLWEQDIRPLGSAIRRHRELQPQGSNVNFVVVRDSGSIEVRTYERGVENETLSCGSGVVASVAVSALFGKVKPPVRVLTRSGITLEVALRVDGGELRDVYLTGDARLIYRGTLSAEALEGFDPDFVRNPTGATVVT
jgi:diaminopimelate epimerase